MTRRWLKKRLPQAAECRRRLGFNRWTRCDGTGHAKARSWPARAISRLLCQFDDPRVWHINRRSVAGAVAIGLFVGWLPIPAQMIVAACCAAMLRVHVPLSVVMVWFTNPLTVAPLGYVAWRIGSTLLGSAPPAQELEGVGIGRMTQALWDAWPEVLVGCVFAGAVSAVVGYLVTLGLWRVSAIRRWRRRKLTPLATGEAE